jgi:hypothetical protein
MPTRVEDPVSPVARDVRHFEMALTRDDFLRLLPLAVGPRRGQRDDGWIDGWTDGVEWSLRIVAAADRRIASLQLPVLHVTLDCSAHDRDAVNRFVERFLRAYQRAGG